MEEVVNAEAVIVEAVIAGRPPDYHDGVPLRRGSFTEIASTENTGCQLKGDAR